jgi:hypothetical protein
MHLSRFLNIYTSNGCNLFGPAVIFACFFSSLETYHQDIYNFYIFIPLGINIIIAVNYIAYILSYRAPKIRNIINTWQKTLILVTDIAMLLLICKPMSRNTNSQMHIPIEFAYIPVIICTCFIIERSLHNSLQGRMPMNTTTKATEVAIVTLSFISFLTICLYDKHGIDLTNRIDGWVRISSFIAAVIIYSIPLDTISKPHHIEVIQLSLSKISVLVIGIVLFGLKSTPPANNMYKLHDYYSLRVLAQYNPELEARSDVIPYHKYEILQDTPIVNTLLNILLKCTFILLAGKSFSLVKHELSSILSVPGNTRSKKFIHEQVLCYLIACILVAVLVVSRHVQNLRMISFEKHSDGFVWVFFTSLLVPTLLSIIEYIPC